MLTMTHHGFSMLGVCSQNQYMGFGLSGRPGFTYMVGADATIAWLDNRNGMPNAVDYFITGRTQVKKVGLDLSK